MKAILALFAIIHITFFVKAQEIDISTTYKIAIVANQNLLKKFTEKEILINKIDTPYKLAAGNYTLKNASQYAKFSIDTAGVTGAFTFKTNDSLITTSFKESYFQNSLLEVRGIKRHLKYIAFGNLCETNFDADGEITDTYVSGLKGGVETVAIKRYLGGKIITDHVKNVYFIYSFRSDWYDQQYEINAVNYTDTFWFGKLVSSVFGNTTLDFENEKLKTKTIFKVVKNQGFEFVYNNKGVLLKKKKIGPAKKLEN